MTDLSLVPTEDMWAEIKKRTSAAVLIELKEKTDEEDHVLKSYHGGRYTCLGMIAGMVKELLTDEGYSPDVVEY